MTNQAYQSKKLTVPQEVNLPGGAKEKLNPYFADQELQKAVNLAILLKRPLLIMGEPGCGKSVLAKAIAYEWYEEKMHTMKKYFEWSIKSTSKAREGLYDFDHLLRLRDANYKVEGADIKDNNRYRRFGPLADAMRNSTADERAILLIDEIDKADIDFSNDLLTELDRNSFYIPETNETFSYPEGRPLIIITSNGEKDLSDAFLRRCVFHYIDLFSASKVNSIETKRWLKNIVSARFYSAQQNPEETLIERAISTFVVLRTSMNAEASSYRKFVNTSEFIDWFEALQKATETEALGLEKDPDLAGWLDTTKSGKIPVPFGNVLFKTTASLLNKFRERTIQSGNTIA
jgi:MoxR-like ATPase